MALPPTVSWQGAADGALVIIDQTLLPGELKLLELRTLDQVIDAIRRLAVRGAPAIGVAGAYGCVIALREGLGEAGLERIANSRPTAVNLRWAVERVKAAGGGAAGALEEARRIHAQDEDTCRRIGEHGAELIRNNMTVLTHCNAGALATGGIGTALAPLYVAHANGKRFAVFADETRPLLQGARLTAFELSENGIDVTVIGDSTAPTLLRDGKVHIVITGADRIARNGDTANKIGTYGVALAAKAHGVPFYVAAPRSTFDPEAATGAEIPIEERAEDEIREFSKNQVVPKTSKVYNPAFDVTPAKLITGLITEEGIFSPEEIDSWLSRA
jgi:methylthioribose-1-phosphate isomerase